MKKGYLTIAAVALASALVLAACGGGGGSSSSETSEASAASETSETSAKANESKPASAGKEPAAAAGGAVAVVSVGKAGDLGEVIVDSKGMTLYDFHKDKGTTSSCYGECASIWPPLLTSGKPKAEGGAMASLLGTTKRKDGTMQVTYKGHPLYGFVEDKKPGEAKGNDFKGFGAQWYALHPNGEEPEDS